MTTTISPSKNWSSANKLYWQNHVSLIKILGLIGPKLPVTARVSLFWLKTRLALVYSDADPELLRRADELIDELVFERINGWEPAHSTKLGKYI